ncbi:hypothetical protein [Faecalibacterium longum]|uniref:Uncharacterized protein n=1 Tax=Faecalibacterium longum TaxID=1851428 RepID=A0ABV1ILR4_9FIRM|nr:hypothetical protein [Faecalibacterium longum]MCC2181637.1 hypothetical protein [Faecalibacterium longum CLA-AA-H236]
MSNPLARRARIKDLSNKAEGIFQYVGNDNVLFRLISTGNKLTSDVNYAVALFTGFARSHQLGSQETRRKSTRFIAGSVSSCASSTSFTPLLARRSCLSRMNP